MTKIERTKIQGLLIVDAYYFWQLKTRRFPAGDYNADAGGLFWYFLGLPEAGVAVLPAMMTADLNPGIRGMGPGIAPFRSLYEERPLKIYGK